MQLTLCNGYTERAFTHDYVFTFNFSGKLYGFIVTCDTAEQLMKYAKLDKASRNGGFSIRFRPNTRQKYEMVKNSAFVICSTDYFNQVFADSKYNRGEIAEMLVTEQVFGQTWEKDSVPFYDGADIYTDDKAYQHKHEGATFTNERTLNNIPR